MGGFEGQRGGVDGGVGGGGGGVPCAEREKLLCHNVLLIPPKYSLPPFPTNSPSSTCSLPRTNPQLWHSYNSCFFYHISDGLCF